MSEKENLKEKEENADKKEEKRKKSRKPEKKTQAQIIQEALGMNPEDIRNIEEKLFTVRFLDYFSEEPLDFIFKDKSFEKYLEKIEETIAKMGEGSEEDKLLKLNYEEKQISKTVRSIKERTEKLAREKGFKTSPDKLLRKYSLLVTLPMLAFVVIFTIYPLIDFTLMFVVLCVFCMLPQFLRGFVLRKWFRFKDENRTDIYTSNRDDIIIIKSFIGETLSNIRARLLELKVPLQLIKFVLHSTDYEGLHLISQKTYRGLTHYYVHFEYPEGIEPIPIPENLRQFEQPVFPKKEEETAEKNFIVLTDLKAKDGVIESFVPSLKDKLADKINDMLNNSEFTPAEIDFTKIIPNYGQNLVIYCLCGEVAEIINVQICTWKKQFKYYLFESMRCNCGEKVYVLSLMDDTETVPEELMEIFSS
ncbi:MAG: hypothetical protein ACTSRH_01560 [Promethearchaeota archaeon]